MLAAGRQPLVLLVFVLAEPEPADETPSCSAFAALSSFLLGVGVTKFLSNPRKPPRNSCGCFRFFGM
jgi:hypothetical protein